MLLTTIIGKKGTLFSSFPSDVEFDFFFCSELNNKDA